eukprot:TRINITY_DN3268_c1_g1_i1.p1 TRINITY_DN3268_c1_g1~~TRINITY_DN3268_c1_g1_i1.p1  ORF type:complete len:876 (+),score=396.46 TRINITY_DN3268_c1_g1_i1:69-2696(+)
MAKSTKRTKKFLPKLKKLKKKWEHEKDQSGVVKKSSSSASSKRQVRSRKAQLKQGAEKDPKVQKALREQKQATSDDSDQETSFGFDGLPEAGKGGKGHKGAPSSLDQLFEQMEVPSDVSDAELSFSEDEEDELSVKRDVESFATKEEDDLPSDDEEAMLERELAAHRDELDTLRKKDPAFYAMLEGEGASGRKGKGGAAREEEEGDLEEEEAGGESFLQEDLIGRGPKGTKQRVVSEEYFEACCEAAANGSGKALRALISMFRAACHFMEDADLDATEKNRGPAPYRYIIPDSTVYNEVMLFGLNNLPKLLDFQLGLASRKKIDVFMDADAEGGGEEGSEDEDGSNDDDDDDDDDDDEEEEEAAAAAASKTKGSRGVFGSGTVEGAAKAKKESMAVQSMGEASASAAKEVHAHAVSSAEVAKGKAVRLCLMKRRRTRKWKQWEAALKSFLSNAFHFFQSCPQNQTSMLGYAMRRLEAFIHLYSPFVPVAKMLLKYLITTWVTGEDATRILAFLNIRTLALVAPYPFCEWCMKGTYLAFVRNSKSFNRKIEPHNQLLMNCTVEVFGSDLKSAYQIAFVHIRQLAIALRTAIVTKTKVAHQAVYNWSFVNAIKFFSALLVRFVNNADLQMLQYPLIQVVSGVIHLIPTRRFFPLRFICVRALCDLAEATGTFIPVASHLLAVFDDIVGSKKKVSRAAAKPLDFEVTLKAPDSALNTRVYLEGVVEQSLELLIHHFSAYALSVAFPELTFAACSLLRKNTKALFSHSSQIAARVKQFIKIVEKNSEWIKQQRRNVTFAPKDKHSVQTFLQGEKFAKNCPLLQHRRQQVEAKKQLLQNQLASGVFEEEEEEEEGSGGSSDEYEGEFEYEGESEEELEFE